MTADHLLKTYHRRPTPDEIRFGYGCTHYMDFSPAQYLRSDGRPKRWVKGPDGLRYYRSIH